MLSYLLILVFLASWLMDLAPEFCDREMWALLVFSIVLRPSIVREMKFWPVNCSKIDFWSWVGSEASTLLCTAIDCLELFALLFCAFLVLGFLTVPRELSMSDIFTDIPTLHMAFLPPSFNLLILFQWPWLPSSCTTDSSLITELSKSPSSCTLLSWMSFRIRGFLITRGFY